MAFKELKQGNRGRPPLLTMLDDKAEEYGIKIGEFLAKGMYLREAASLAGISHFSVYRYLRKGEADLEKDITNTPAAVFATLINEGMAKAEEGALGNILAAGSNPAHWPANAWFLERRFPDKYGKQDRTEVTIKDSITLGQPDKPLEERLDDEVKRTAAKEIAGNLAKLGIERGS